MNFKRFHSFKKTKNNQGSLSLSQMIEKATLATNTSEDILISIKICKEINYEKKASRKAAEEISKRLKPKVEPQTQFLTISLLRIISENCKPFEQELRKQEFLNRFSFLWLQKDLHTKVRDNMESCIYMWLHEYKDDLYMLKVHDMCTIIYEREVQQACNPQPSQTPLTRNNIHPLNKIEPLDAATLVDDPETQKLINNLGPSSQSSRGYLKRTVSQVKNDKGKSPLRQNDQNNMTEKEIDALIEEAGNLNKLVSELLEMDGTDEILNDLLKACCKQHTTLIQQFCSMDDPHYISVMTDAARDLFGSINSIKARQIHIQGHRWIRKCKSIHNKVGKLSDWCV